MIVEVVEFLIANGHSFGDIRRYSLPQLFLFQELIGSRMKAEVEVIKKLREGSGNAGAGRKVETSGRSRQSRRQGAK